MAAPETPNKQTKSRELDELRCEAWKTVLTSNPHGDKLKKAIAINPESVGHLLRRYHLAEQTHSRKMLHILRGFSEELEGMGDELKEDYDIDSFITGLIEMEKEGGEASLCILDEGRQPQQRDRNRRRVRIQTQTDRPPDTESPDKIKDRLRLKMFSPVSDHPFVATPRPPPPHRWLGAKKSQESTKQSKRRTDR